LVIGRHVEEDISNWWKVVIRASKEKSSFESLQPIHEEMPSFPEGAGRIVDCVKLITPSYKINYAAIARYTSSGYPEVKWFPQPTSKGIAPRNLDDDLE
jgi:hypothetical protein